MIKREMSRPHSKDFPLVVSYEDMKNNVSREVGVATVLTKMS